MEIAVSLDMILLKRKMTLTELSQRIGISVTNLSLLKTGKVRGIRFGTLAAICRELDCQPGDLLTYELLSNKDSDVPGRRDEDV